MIYTGRICISSPFNICSAFDVQEDEKTVFTTKSNLCKFNLYFANDEIIITLYS